MRLLTLGLLLLTTVSCSNAVSMSAGRVDGDNSTTVGAIAGRDKGASSLVDLAVEQTSSPIVFAGQKRVDVPFKITLRNTSQEPLTVRRIVVQSASRREFEIPTTMRKFDRTIGPDESVELTFWTTAEVSEARMSGREPLVLRITSVLDVGGKEYREVFQRNVNGRFSAGVSSYPRSQTAGSVTTLAAPKLTNCVVNCGAPAIAETTLP
jgi:hypothetical protein